MEDELLHPDLPHCARCGSALTNSDGLDTDGLYVCDDFHGHDEYGVFAPAHSFTVEGALDEDDKYFIVHDGTDKCHYDSNTETWVVSHNPFTSREETDMALTTARGYTLRQSRMHDITSMQIFITRWMNHPATDPDMRVALKDADDALDVVYGLLQEEED